jgi:hypothetical protein
LATLWAVFENFFPKASRPAIDAPIPVIILTLSDKVKIT